jgi:hypothetical protein
MNTRHILNQAKRAAHSAISWADLANTLFNPDTGLITRAYPTRAEREEFVKTDEYKTIRRLLSDAIDTYGLVEGATPS